MSGRFARFAGWCARAAGSPWAFALALATVLAWAASGPVFGYSGTWQLVINTGTTVVTFLMIFLVQSSQNRDTAEIKALLRQIAEDLPQVHDERVAARVAAELGAAEATTKGEG